MRASDFKNLLVIGVFVPALTLVVQAVSPQETAVKGVELNASGQSLEARITATGPARFTYFELEGPRRLVVDFHGLKNGLGFTQKKVEGGTIVERVRASNFASTSRKATRIVFDIALGASYEVLDEGGGLVRVLFDAPGARAARAENRVPANLVAGPPVLPTEEVTTILQRALELPLPVLAAAAFEPPAPPPVAPAAVAATAPRATTTLSIQSPSAASRVAAPILAQLGGQISVAPPVTVPTITGPAQNQTYNGEIITLDLVDVDMKEFFHGLGEFTGLNIILDSDVNGRITILLTDVPWDQALDIILRTYNLGGQLQGNVLRVARRQTLVGEETQRAQAAAAIANAAPLIARSYILSYTKAGDVARTLTSSGALSGRGKVTEDTRRNAIIVQDIPEQFDTIEQLKNFLDVPSQQVEIEARLLTANKSFLREFGSQLGLLIGANNGNMITGGTGTSSPFARTPAPRASVGGSGLPLVSNLPAAATSGLAFLIQPGGDILLDQIISAAEASGTARLLSRPKIATQNNQLATITQGTQIPVQQSVNNTITVNFMTFALKLDVTPQIAEKGTVLLTVAIENSQPDFARAVNGVPSVSTQQAKTQLLVADGATMMIGGILVDTDSLNIRQVPGLGSIPVIGNLFKNTQTIKSTAELLFFVTPRIKPADAVIATAPGN